MYLYVDGYSVGETSQLLRISIGSVQAYKQKYERGKLKEIRILSYSSGRPSHLTNVQQKALKDCVEQGHYMTSKAVCEVVRITYNVEYTANAMTKLLKRLGFVHKKPKTVPGKADAAKQETFIRETLHPLLKKAGDASPVYFEDAVHMQHNTQAAYGWILKGHTKELKQNTGRKRININGAFCYP